MNNYDYNTLSGLRAAMVELKTAAAAAGLENKVGDLAAQLKQAKAELRKAKNYAKTK